MSAELRQDSQSPAGPASIRTKKSPIKGPIVGILILAIGCSIAANFALSSFRNQKAQTELYAWTAQLQKDNPAITFGGFNAHYSGDLLGTFFQYQGKYKTPTGHPIAIDFNLLGRPWGDAGRLILSAEAKSLTLPLRDLEGGRKLDLKAEFPEAFR